MPRSDRLIAIPLTDGSKSSGAIYRLPPSLGFAALIVPLVGRVHAAGSSSHVPESSADGTARWPASRPARCVCLRSPRAPGSLPRRRQLGTRCTSRFCVAGRPLNAIFRARGSVLRVRWQMAAPQYTTIRCSGLLFCFCLGFLSFFLNPHEYQYSGKKKKALLKKAPFWQTHTPANASLCPSRDPTRFEDSQLPSVSIPRAIGKLPSQLF